ncbi:MAG: RNA polymerase sigma-70 factor [Flavobacteriaceae bacterium]|nr:RNA polymerase sigma-70 factor [Flavobacteriaceae bacterium]
MGAIQLNADEIRFRQFKRGNEIAFSFYFNAYYNRIVGFCIQFLGDEDKAKSVSQEAFIKLWTNRSKVRKIAGIKSFLYTSAKSDCLNVIRHKEVVKKYQNSQLQVKENELNIEILNSLNFDSMSFSELERQIEDSINNLPKKCKLVFIKSRRENKKNKEIAGELGISVKAVEANITRALKVLKLQLTDYLPIVLIAVILKSI